MGLESDIVDHYSGSQLLAAIQAGVAALGKTTDTVTIDDLAPVDEFHIGGRAATVELCDQAGVEPISEVLDVGSGIGGTSRFVAATYGCRVTGIDLTDSYVEVGAELTAWTGLTEQVTAEVGSALDMPFDSERFDQAIQLHVGMNIPDKAMLFAEVARVLRPGGCFAVYDIMRVGDRDPTYPVPWATDESTSFLTTPGHYRDTLQRAGFEITATRDRGDYAREFFGALAARTADAAGPPPLGLHLIMGADAPTKIAHMVEAVGGGLLAPVEMICRKPSN